VTPAGLISVEPGFRKRIIALYAVLAALAIAMPALLSQPRSSSPHPTEQEARRPPATGAAADAPGR
jgi:hypothetical protein